MSDAHFSLSVKLRLRMDVNCPSDMCGTAALTDKTGGAVVRRHDRLRDTLAQILESGTGRPTQTEQVVPAWCTEQRDARLDIAYTDDNAYVIHVDVAVVHSLRSSNAKKAPALRDGYTCAVEETNKRRLYPGGRLTPTVFETHGRCGDAMAAMLRSVYRGLPPDERASALGSSWQTLSCTLQRGNAEILLSACPP